MGLLSLPTWATPSPTRGVHSHPIRTQMSQSHPLPSPKVLCLLLPRLETPPTKPSHGHQNCLTLECMSSLLAAVTHLARTVKDKSHSVSMFVCTHHISIINFYFIPFYSIFIYINISFVLITIILYSETILRLWNHYPRKL